TALVRTRRSLGPRSRFHFRDEVLEPQTSRRLDLAEVREEFFFVECLPRPGEEVGGDPLTRERLRLIGLIGFHRSLPCRGSRYIWKNTTPGGPREGKAAGCGDGFASRRRR